MSGDLFDLSGQVAIVTGASRGLGQHMAQALAKAGADLVVTSRDPKNLSEFEREIKATGRRVLSLELDVHATWKAFSAWWPTPRRSTAASIFW